jgi:hypothetical protein
MRYDSRYASDERLHLLMGDFSLFLELDRSISIFLKDF